MSLLIWGGTDGWDQGDHLAKATQRAGLDLAGMDRRIVAAADRLESVIENNQTDHDQSGHWGVPTCAYKDEPFFGQDRLDVLLWRLKKEGLRTAVQIELIEIPGGSGVEHVTYKLPRQWSIRVEYQFRVL